MCRSLWENHPGAVGNGLHWTEPAAQGFRHLRHDQAARSPHGGVMHIWSDSLPPTAGRLPPPPDHSQGAALPTPPPQTAGGFQGKVPYLLSHWCVSWPQPHNYVAVFIANLFFNMSPKFLFLHSYAISQPVVFAVVWQSTEIFKNILLAELVAFLTNWMLGPASSGSCSIPLVVCSLQQKAHTVHFCVPVLVKAVILMQQMPTSIILLGSKWWHSYFLSLLTGILLTGMFPISMI